MKRFDVSTEWRGSRLDRFIRAHLPGTPFGVIQILLRKGLIYLNGERASGSARLQSGDAVSIDIHEADENAISASAQRRVSPKPVRVKTPRRRPARRPEAGAAREALATIGAGIPVLYEDDHVLVIDKPAGVVVQPGNRADKGSLLDLLEEYRLARKGEPGAEEGAAVFRYTPVHRLDRETSGCLVIAKTRPAARSLAASFAAHRVLKVYIAIVEGVPPEPARLIASPLETLKGRRSHTVPSASGKGSRTFYVLAGMQGSGHARLIISIYTGRTHQIRAHLASLGTPVLGDAEYGGVEKTPDGRLMLHAWRIEFPHPATGETVSVTSPEPREFS